MVRSLVFLLILVLAPQQSSFLVTTPRLVLDMQKKNPPPPCSYIFVFGSWERRLKAVGRTDGRTDLGSFGKRLSKKKKKRLKGGGQNRYAPPRVHVRVQPPFDIDLTHGSSLFTLLSFFLSTHGRTAAVNAASLSISISETLPVLPLSHFADHMHSKIDWVQYIVDMQKMETGQVR